MESQINERINSLMESQKLNVNNFSKAIGKSYTAVYGIVKGVSKPGFDLLEAIMATYPELNTTWLLTGKGEMFGKEDKQPNESDSYLKEHLKALEDNFARLTNQLETKDKLIETLTHLLEVSMTQKASEKSFLNGTSFEGRVIPFTPVKNEKATA